MRHPASFNDGGMLASAGDVRYKVSAGSVDITGKIGNALPHVSNDEIVVDAGHIEMILDGPKMTASDGPVRTVLKAAKYCFNNNVGATSRRRQCAHRLHRIADGTQIHNVVRPHTSSGFDLPFALNHSNHIASHGLGHVHKH